MENELDILRKNNIDCKSCFWGHTSTGICYYHSVGERLPSGEYKNPALATDVCVKHTERQPSNTYFKNTIDLIKERTGTYEKEIED